MGKCENAYPLLPGVCRACPQGSQGVNLYLESIVFCKIDLKSENEIRNTHIMTTTV